MTIYAYLVIATSTISYAFIKETIEKVGVCAGALNLIPALHGPQLL